MAVLSQDILWVVDHDGLVGGVYRTTNGGTSWDRQFNGGSYNPDHIYMFNDSLGFFAKNIFPPVNNLFRRTTNGGLNWTNITNDGFLDMHFVDNLTGWKCTPSYDGDSSVKKTTDGGLTWHKQILPHGGIINLSQIVKFSFINKDTIWGVGGQISYNKAIFFRTTDGGDTWKFQIPDTNFGLIGFGEVQFINRNIGWAYQNTMGIHTTTGGDTNWLSGIKQVSSKIPKEFKLYQNYPNPFNPTTIIKYQITKRCNVKLLVYDITGKEIMSLVNEEQTTGLYKVDFSGINYSSGVYFYSLIVDGQLVDTKKFILLK